jgi:hypothetical protein
MDYRTGYTSWDRGQPEPGHLREYEGDTFMNRASSTGGGVVNMIQRNPIPAALAGVGIGWLLMRRSTGDHNGDQPYYYRPGQQPTYPGNYGYDTQGYGYQSYGNRGNWQQGTDSDSGRMGDMTGTVRETASDAVHRAQDVGSQATDQVSQFSSMARDHVGDLPHQAQDQFQHLRSTYQQKMQDHPLPMGIVAMGLGLAVGMLLPETEKENEVFGEKRDELMERAQDVAGQAVVNAQEAAQSAVQSAQSVVGEKVTEAVKETISDATHGNSQTSTSPS